MDRDEGTDAHEGTGSEPESGHHHESGGHGESGHHHSSGDHDRAGHHDEDRASVGFGLLTVSSSRTLEEDATGDALEGAIGDAGMAVESRSLVHDEVAPIRATVEGMISDEAVDVVVITGGTGLTRDDVTPQAVDPLLTRQIPGFGELFRMLSYEDVGALAVLSRASAGLADVVPVFCLPGSEPGAMLGLEELILPTAGHLVGLAREHEE
jgi:molybdenum cofactor biosynthesis protein B